MATVLALGILTILAYLERRIEASQGTRARGEPPSESQERHWTSRRRRLQAPRRRVPAC
jgi:hypothetical protein